ncbi:hypothetical protein CEUSTIGMA_g9545.t1 [Chlamydomonas eustigma]|uniref:Uncharacterized protein n=1 Tax=Chlamydomonas eustigma TaxID=1157962 RepID=A0A250XGB4_9CHLO|nr:hypothetical protein CEUSTIGMA_g9545.t1 [Chlamydomonas eustigma]|eukprot:GAX82117.1 hypothetical protein CEUSTIGMA_g9545.t1 [Chlamydomonas eustigma]
MSVHRCRRNSRNNNTPHPHEISSHAVSDDNMSSEEFEDAVGDSDDDRHEMLSADFKDADELEDALIGPEYKEEDQENEAGDDEENEEKEEKEDDDDDDDDDEVEEEEDEDEGISTRLRSRSLASRALSFMLGLRNEDEDSSSRGDHLSRFKTLPQPPQPLKHELAWRLNAETTGINKRQCCGLPHLDKGRIMIRDEEYENAASPSRARNRPDGPLLTPAVPPTDTSVSKDGDRSDGRRNCKGNKPGVLGLAVKNSSCSGKGEEQSSEETRATRSASKKAKAETIQTPEIKCPDVRLLNTNHLLMKRELGLGDMPGFSKQALRHLQIGRPSTLPNHPQRRIESVSARAYIGQYSKDGTFFVAAFQDQRVKLYDVENGWTLRKDVRTRMCRWTVTDTTVSPDQRFVIYASISPVAHLVEVGNRYDSVVESISNVTEIHEALCFDMHASSEGQQRSMREFGIWSIKWSGDGREIIAGTNDERVYVYDMESSRVVAFVDGHDDDVNAVAYLDSTPNLIASGSDDNFVKIWDRRLIDQKGRCRPVGVLLGHTEGLTHLDAKGDGRYLISNCKDQTIKLWDLRCCMLSEQEAKTLSEGHGVPRFRWDYRWMQYPGFGYDVRHPQDKSIATFRGHEVRQTLIRAYFSPEFTTGQRYIYSGGMDGCVRMWDIVTGETVQKLSHHQTLVRDCSWHPYQPRLTTVSWDGSVVEWGPEDPDSKSIPKPGLDPMEDFY